MSYPQKFVFVGPVTPFRGGIAHFGNALISHLRTRGHVVSILNFRRLYPQWCFPGKTQMEPDSASDFPGENDCIDSLNPATWIRTANAIAAIKPDFVVFQYWEPLLAPIYGTIARLSRRNNTKLICIVHNALPHEKRPGAARLGLYFLSACDELIALSETVESDLTQRLGLGRKVSRLFHPVYEHFGDLVSKSDARHLLNLGTQAKVVLFFGLVRKYKGLEVLLKAMQIVIRTVPQASLIVAGEFYDDKVKYERQIVSLELDKCVRLEDRYIPASEVSRYFCAADLVVLPYLSATQSGVLSTAYHFEKPFVITQVEGLVEMRLSNCHLVVEPNNVPELAKAIISFFLNEKPEELLSAIRYHKQRYSWMNFCEQFEQIATNSNQP